MTDHKPLHIQQAEGLRALAEMIEQNPEVAEFAGLTNLYGFYARSAEDHATIARAALASGAKVDKDVSETQYNLRLGFGPAVDVYVLANREQVCERVVVGTETVTKTVKDPAKLAEVPEIEVVETVEHVAWQCKPLLAVDGES